MIDLTKPVVDNIAESQCLYSCKGPRGSFVLGIIIMFTGIVIVPVFIDLLEGILPLTVDNFLQLMFDEFARVIGYYHDASVYTYIIYFLFSFLSGMACVKAAKGLALPFTFLAISILGFFFLALFIIGIPVDYNEFFYGIAYNMLKFSAVMLFPCLLGIVATRVTLSKKNCFVNGK